MIHLWSHILTNQQELDKYIKQAQTSPDLQVLNEKLVCQVGRPTALILSNIIQCLRKKSQRMWLSS